MISLLPAAVRGTLAFLLFFACLVAAGCASDNRFRHNARGGPAHQQAIPTLTGRESFFSERITAEVRIGAMAGFDRSGDGEDRHEGRSRRRGPPGGLSGGGMGGGPGGNERRMSPGGEEDRPEPGRRPAMAMSGPPVAIHLRFTNRGSAAVDLRVVDFLSPLGNFVVHPSSLRLEPGQSLEVEPMASGLAAEAGSGEITLSLQLDDSRETKTVTLQPEAASNPPIKP